MRRGKSKSGKAMRRRSALALALCAGIPIGHGSDDGSACPPGTEMVGLCDSEMCPWHLYGEDAMTWYQQHCKAHCYDHPNDVSCQQDLSQKDGDCFEDIVFHIPDAHLQHDHSHHSVPYNILVLFCSFATGAAVRFLLKGTKIPYTVVLFLIGMSWGALSKFDALDLENYVGLAYMDPHLIFHIFLPPLIFESAFMMDIPTFKKVVWQCLILAGPGLMVASFLTGSVAKFLFTSYAWNWYACLLYGVIMSATDPVAVVALLKELGASPVISTMIEGESLFNDGTAIVFFHVLVEAVQKVSCTPLWSSCILDFSIGSVVEHGAEHAAHHGAIAGPLPPDVYGWPDSSPHCLCTVVDCVLDKKWHDILLQFCKVAFGGTAIGFVFGGFAVTCLNNVFDDPLIEITLTLCIAYVTFFVAEGILGVSGVLGVVACGCVMSYYNTCISPAVEHTLHHFWEMLTYLANTSIFILAGVIVSIKAYDSVDATDLTYLVITYVAINIVRMFCILLFSPIFCCFRYRLGTGNTCLVAWGGLRGAVGLALALMIQADEQIAIETVRTKFIFHVSGIVLLTLCVNGSTTGALVRRFKLDEVSYRRRKVMETRYGQLGIEKQLDVTHLGEQPLNYDANWENVDKLVDLDSAIPEGHSDPYNHRSWAAKQTAENDDETLDRKAREVGRMAYLSTLAASNHHQYARGTLSAMGCRRLHHLIVACRDKGDRQQELRDRGLPVPQDYEEDDSRRVSGANFDKSMFGTAAPKAHSICLMKTKGLAKFFNAGCMERNSFGAIQERRRRDEWRRGIDLCLGFITAHHAAQDRIHDLCEPYVANKITTHCKKVNKEAIELLDQVTRERPDIACGLKSRQAARLVLNHMSDEIKVMRREGRLDDQDRAALDAIILRQQKGLRIPNLFRGESAKVPVTVAYPTGIEGIEDTVWFQAAEEPCKRHLAGIAQSERSVIQMTNKVSLCGTKQKKNPTLPGLVLILQGIIEIKVGRKLFDYGAGYTLGWQQVMSGSTRFNHAATKTTCNLLIIPAKEVLQLVSLYPDFKKAAWRECGVSAARLLMRFDDKRFPVKEWPSLRIRRLAESGTADLVQDDQQFRFSDERRIKLGRNRLYVLLRGRGWEYGEQGDHVNEFGDDKPTLQKFPTMLPGDFRFATFTHHAVLFTMEEDLSSAQHARRLWGLLAGKVRSIFMWSALRGKHFHRACLALAMDRSAPPTPSDGPIETPPEVLRDRARRKFAAMEESNLNKRQGGSPRSHSPGGEVLSDEDLLERRHGGVEIVSCMGPMSGTDDASPPRSMPRRAQTHDPSPSHLASSARGPGPLLGASSTLAGSPEPPRSALSNPLDPSAPLPGASPHPSPSAKRGAASPQPSMRGAATTVPPPYPCKPMLAGAPSLGPSSPGAGSPSRLAAVMAPPPSLGPSSEWTGAAPPPAPGPRRSPTAAGSRLGGSRLGGSRLGRSQLSATSPAQKDGSPSDKGLPKEKSVLLGVPKEKSILLGVPKGQSGVRLPNREKREHTPPPDDNPYRLPPDQEQLNSIIADLDRLDQGLSIAPHSQPLLSTYSPSPPRSAPRPMVVERDFGAMMTEPERNLNLDDQMRERGTAQILLPRPSPHRRGLGARKPSL